MKFYSGVTLANYLANLDIGGDLGCYYYFFDDSNWVSICLYSNLFYYMGLWVYLLLITDMVFRDRCYIDFLDFNLWIDDTLSLSLSIVIFKVYLFSVFTIFLDIELLSVTERWSLKLKILVWVVALLPVLVPF